MPDSTPVWLQPLHSDSWQRWVEAKLAAYPRSMAQLVVDIATPQAISPEEHQQLAMRISSCNMAIYCLPTPEIATKESLRAIAAHFGLLGLDSNYLADEDGISAIEVAAGELKPNYIPYTNRAIHWHCDGYYNRPGEQIQAMVLQCVRSAAAGGESGLLDHELVWLLLRQQSPEAALTLMEPDILTIPAGKDGAGAERGASVGPLFSITAEGRLHMRYSARKRHIEWRQDRAAVAARALLEQTLAECDYVLTGRLEPGMGLICNNVLHRRAAFEEPRQGAGRLLYRARYHRPLRL
ncbi:taurine catabolism dioxygenase TauD [Ectothiorhodospiraceae bacterium BW-2]|nr:taurine catabolism dioxygenase TauD [Ectothiorhodospiraceae bacterium BW-2]